jgi:hypothetical protein
MYRNSLPFAKPGGKRTKKITLNRIVIIGEASDGTYHQVDLNDKEVQAVKDLLAQLHNDKVRMLKEKLDTVYFEWKN